MGDYAKASLELLPAHLFKEFEDNKWVFIYGSRDLDMYFHFPPPSKIQSTEIQNTEIQIVKFEMLKLRKKKYEILKF
jgi:hypothetical protein